MSESHACALVGLSRDTYRHVGQTSALNVELRESFNGTFRDECLDENWFESLEQARPNIVTWRTDYNEIRPQSSCGRVPPATFAALHRQLTGDAKQDSNNDAGIS